MKKIISALLIAAMIATFCAIFTSAEQVIVSNHNIDENPEQGGRFIDDEESAWLIYGWVCSNVKLLKVGYILDGGDVVWAADEVGSEADEIQGTGSFAYYDAKLSSDLIYLGLSNELNPCVGTRFHIEIPTLELEKGEHEFEIMATFEDGSVDNCVRGSLYTFTKTKDAVIDPNKVTEEATQEVTEEATVEATEEVTEAIGETEAITEAGSEAVTEAETDDVSTTGSEETKDEGPNLPLIIGLICGAVVIIAAAVGVVLAKKKKQ